MHFAINAADIEQVQELVAAGISLDYIIYANTPLTLAILKEHYDIAHVLLDGGANVNFPEQMAWKRLPLHLVAKDGRLDLVQKIVAKGRYDLHYENVSCISSQTMSNKSL